MTSTVVGYGNDCYKWHPATVYEREASVADHETFVQLVLSYTAAVRKTVFLQCLKWPHNNYRRRFGEFMQFL